MPRVSASGLHEASGNKPVSNGWLDLLITQSKANELESGKVSWEVHLKVENSDTAEDVGREFVVFYPLNGYSEMKDGGRFVKNLLHDQLEAIGIEVESDDTFDTDEAVGARFRALNKCRANQDDIPREQLVNFKPL